MTRQLQTKAAAEQVCLFQNSGNSKQIETKRNGGKTRVAKRVLITCMEKNETGRECNESIKMWALTLHMAMALCCFCCISIVESFSGGQASELGCSAAHGGGLSNTLSLHGNL